MSDINEKFEEFKNTKDTTKDFFPDDIKNNNSMAALAYLSWLVLIPLIFAKDSPYARYHVNQGLVLAIAETIGIMAFNIVAWVPFMGFVAVPAEIIFGLLCLILAIIGIINAVDGRARELPIIGSVRIFK